MTMEVNEDEPEDVKRATPVEQEIKRGEKDETFERFSRSRKKQKNLRHCENLAAKKSTFFSRQKAKDEGCCETRKMDKEKRSFSSQRTIVMVPEKPCTLPKLEILPRQNLTKRQYVDMLATPSRKCSASCAKRMVVRKLRPISERTKELALPSNRRMMMTLQNAAATLPPALVDNLIRTIEGESCLTPEQAAEVFQERKQRKPKSKKVAGRKSTTNGQRGTCEETKGTSTLRKSRKSLNGVDDLTRIFPSLNDRDFDPEAVIRQYFIAARFVKSILDWNCPIPREEFTDIAEVVLRRLAEVLEYSPLDDNEDRKSQQMRLVADLIACWIAGILLEVAEDHRREIEKECLQKQKEMLDDQSDSEEEDNELYERLTNEEI